MASNTAQMQQMPDFEYMNKDSIDVELVCIICTDPFVNPCTLWMCGHTFCRVCIEETLKNSRVCPLCRNTTMFNGLIPATRNLVNMLNRLLVRCEYCNEENIRRDNFNEHIERLCPKIIVCCPAGNDSCIWTGFREEFAIHHTQCTAELKSSFDRQFVDIEKQMKQLQYHVDRIISQQKQFVPYDKCKLQIDQFHQRCSNLEHENEQLRLQLSELNQRNQSIKQSIPSTRLKGM